MELIEFAEKLGGLGFGTLCVLILVSSYYRIWVWGSVLREYKEEARAALEKAEEETREWKALALDLKGLTKQAVGMAKRVS